MSYYIHLLISLGIFCSGSAVVFAGGAEGGGWGSCDDSLYSGEKSGD